jgi:two-component system response regulator YesN
VERYIQNRSGDVPMWACKARTDMYSILNITENAYCGKKSPEGNEIIRYIKDNVGSTLTLTALCDHFHMSRTTLAKITKELTGLSPMAFLLEERMTLVIPDLLFTSKSISELAEKYGFMDDNYFIRVFKKKYGKPPLQYRIDGRTIRK